MPADLKAVQVPPGTVLLLTGVAPSGEVEREAFMTDLMDQMFRVVGHMKFLLLSCDPDGSDIEVWGPDSDLEAKVRELLERLS